MSFNDEQINHLGIELASLLENTSSSEHTIRKKAEESIIKLEQSCPLYATVALYLIKRNDVKPMTKIAASIAFKNYIRRYWRFDPNDESSDQIDRIDPQQRLFIKQNLTSLMLESQKHVQRQLSQSITIIGKSDFPDQWPSLITELENYLKGNVQSVDFNLLQGVLQTAHSIFRRYRHELPSEKLWAEIKLVLDHLAQPLTSRFKELIEAHKIPQNSSNDLIYQCLLLCVKIYHSLITQDLPEFFEEHLDDWLPNFLILLDMPAISTQDSGLIVDIKSEICEIASLFVQRYSDIENFKEYAQKFADHIWKLLTSTNQDVQYDILVSNAIRYLDTVASRSETKVLFENPQVLELLCQKVIIPNMELREADLELFEDNPDEYVKKDIEGSDVDTRRRAACDLIQTLSKFLESQLITIFNGYMTEIFRIYKDNPQNNWKSKDLALFLFSALAVKQSTRKLGTVAVSQFVNIEDFLKSNIVNELESMATFEGSYVLRADALRYITTFRNNIPTNTLVGLLPTIIRLITSENVVIRAYASITLEKLLLLRVEPKSNVTAFKQEQFEPHLGQLINTLFKALDLPGSTENEYIMKTIMRVFSFFKPESITRFLPIVVPKLTQKLALVAKNPSRPNFNHYLFETLALTVKAACVNNSAFMNEFESVLFNILEAVSSQDIQEFVPYVLQLLNIILDSHKTNAVTDKFKSFFTEVLSPVLWEKPSNVRPLTELMHSYLEKIPSDIVSQEKLLPILGIFQKLVASKATDHDGLALLQTMIIHLPASALETHIRQVFILLFQRLSGSKTAKFVKGLLPCFSLYAQTRGADQLAANVNSLQDGMYGMLLEKVFIPEVKKITDSIDKKICVCGMTKILAHLPLLNNGCHNYLWTPLLHIIIEMLELPAEVMREEEDDYFIEMDDISETCQAQYSKLVFASKKKADPLKDISNLKNNLVIQLAELSARVPGFVSSTLKDKLDPSIRACLEVYCLQANVNLM